MDIDSVLITLLVLLVCSLAIANYCHYLKSKIKDARSVDAEFDDQTTDLIVEQLMKQLKEIEDKK